MTEKWYNLKIGPIVKPEYSLNFICVYRLSNIQKILTTYFVYIIKGTCVLNFKNLVTRVGACGCDCGYVCGGRLWLL